VSFAQEVAEAADTLERTEPQLKKLKAENDAAKKKLKEWFRRDPHRRHYKNRIGYSVTSRTSLDQDKVKSFLGKRLSKFMRESKVESLTLLKK
jgi:hypothetical protein